MLSEISQSEKNNCMVSLMYGSSEQSKLMNKVETEAWTHGTD